jgi:hypothetical protein
MEETVDGCLVSYEIPGEGPGSRLYRFSDDSVTRISLPYSSRRWCSDVTCRGHVDT